MADLDELRRFEWSVRALAQPADLQLQLYPSFVCHADELALEFEEHYALVLALPEDTMSLEQRSAIAGLDEFLSSMSGERNADLWTEHGLRYAAEWNRVRALARDILQAMGWPDVPPPLDRGYVYVRSDA